MHLKNCLSGRPPGARGTWYYKMGDLALKDDEGNAFENLHVGNSKSRDCPLSVEFWYLRQMIPKAPTLQAFACLYGR